MRVAKGQGLWHVSPILVRCCSSVVEHSIGNGEVDSSILSSSTISSKNFSRLAGFKASAAHLSGCVCRSKVRHLVGVGLHEGRPGRGAGDVVAAGGIVRQPVEPIDEAQHIRHQDVGDGEGSGQPFASCQHRLHVLEPVLVEEAVKKLPASACRRCRRRT